MSNERPALGQTFAVELADEAAATRKMLERLPAEKFTWKPHEKSMPLGVLGTHIAEMLDWVKLALTLFPVFMAQQPMTKQFNPSFD